MSYWVEWVDVFTDGACFSNGMGNAQAGIGVFWGVDHPLNVSAPVKGRATNNAGEIQAATKAIRQAADNDIHKLRINTDSKFVIRAATEWMNGWKYNGWRCANGEPVKNERDFKELDKAMREGNVQVKWNYVEAHSSNFGNQMADKLAKAGASRYRRY